MQQRRCLSPSEALATSTSTSVRKPSASATPTSIRKASRRSVRKASLDLRQEAWEGFGVLDHRLKSRPLPDPVLCLVFSFAVGNAREWRNLGLVCAQFQRCALDTMSSSSISLHFRSPFGCCADVRSDHSGVLQSARAKIPGLQKVKLGKDVCDDQMPELVSLMSTMANLRHLDLSGCVLGDCGMRELAKLTLLESLDLTGCRLVSDAGVREVASLTSLVELKLSRCGLVADTGVRTLTKSLPSLRVLDLSYCPLISDHGVGELVLPELRQLDLSGCKSMTDVGFKKLVLFTSLQKLKLRSCAITDDAVAELATITTLRELDLSYCQSISTNGVQKLSKLELSHLGLSGCKQLHEDEMRGVFEKSFQFFLLVLVCFWVVGGD